MEMQTQQLTYRTATENDFAQLKALGNLSYAQFKNVLSEDGWRKMHFNLNDDEAILQLIRISTVFSCFSNGKMVGMAYFIPSGNPWRFYEKEWSYIRMIGVDPEFRGMGIGKKLTEMCVDEAKRRHEKIVMLHTS